MSRNLKPDAAARRWLGYVARVPCVVCIRLGFVQAGRTYVHHIRTDQGAARRASHHLTVALCYLHHQGGLGIHTMGRRAFETMCGCSELQLLADTIARVQLSVNA